MHVLDKDMQAKISSPGLKISRSKELTVKAIFLDIHNWDTYYYINQDRIRDVELEEVQKMLGCKDGDRGFFVFWCHTCKEPRFVYLGCNSRICSNCGKNYTDKWAKSLSRAMFDVPHRHAVLTIPDVLWPIIRENRKLWKVLMDAAIQAINETFSELLKREIQAGAIVVLHPFSRDLGFNSHLHVLMTEGGFDRKRRFIRKAYIPFKLLRKKWQYHVLTRLKAALPDTPKMSRLIDRMFKKHQKGFYVHTPTESRITSKRQIARYIARYVRHPAIANYRLSWYDGETVAFWYKDNEGVKHSRTMGVFEFMEAILQHIPDRQFKMIRYYGAYCRKWKGRYAHYLAQRSIRQTVLSDFPQKGIYMCPVCGSIMTLEMYFPKGPPKEMDFGSKIEDWTYISPRLDYR